jgi:hypothetical protein
LKRLFHSVLDEHFNSPPLVTRKHVIWYCTFPHDDRNFVPGALGVILICSLHVKKNYATQNQAGCSIFSYISNKINYI